MPTSSWSISDFLPSRSWVPSRRSAVSICSFIRTRWSIAVLTASSRSAARASADSRSSSSIGTSGSAGLRRDTTSATTTAATSAGRTTSPSTTTSASITAGLSLSLSKRDESTVNRGCDTYGHGRLRSGVPGVRHAGARLGGDGRLRSGDPGVRPRLRSARRKCPLTCENAGRAAKAVTVVAADGRRERLELARDVGPGRRVCHLGHARGLGVRQPGAHAGPVAGPARGQQRRPGFVEQRRVACRDGDHVSLVDGEMALALGPVALDRRASSRAAGQHGARRGARLEDRRGSW